MSTVNDPALAPSTPDPVSSHVIKQRYRVTRELSDGPMGKLYLADDLGAPPIGEEPELFRQIDFLRNHGRVPLPSNSQFTVHNSQFPIHILPGCGIPSSSSRRAISLEKIRATASRRFRTSASVSWTIGWRW